MNISPIIKQIKNINFLIVSKDIDKRVKIETILNKYGLYNRTFVNDIKIAEDMCMSGVTKFDIVIIDWINEDKCGAEELCRKLNKLNKSMPVVFLTSKSAENYYKAFQMGAIDVIGCPIKEADLIEMIWAGSKIESFRKQMRDKDFYSFKKQAFFRLAVMAN